MNIPGDAQAAKELVRKIASDHGYLPPEEFQKIPDPDTRRRFEESHLQKDKLVGSSVIALAKNLYASKTHFLFELLRNADDNSYTRAKELGEDPYVSFTVYPNRVVVECNEDGFTAESLKALCSVGRSSKAAAHGYTGEKGIGFKSVFIVAERAHIQSGPFSFAFSHKRGDSGMGMISPTWVETDQESVAPLTRITLDLHQDRDAFRLVELGYKIRTQLFELPESFLLSMKRLRRVEIIFHAMFDAKYTATYTIIKNAFTARISKTMLTVGEVQQSKEYHYNTTTHVIKNIPKHDYRMDTNNEEQSHDDSESEILLAFPISSDGAPLTDNVQSSFALLPMLPTGFRFMIQADFVTDASRQNIMQHSLRNQKLLDGITFAFVQAVLQFCENDTLRYQWMRYLPDTSRKDWDPFWLSLANRIIDSVRESPVLYSRRGPEGHRVKDLYCLQNEMVDDGEEHLFDDDDPEHIISQHYEAPDLELLKSCGLQFASHVDLLPKWIQKDLWLGARSRMKLRNTPLDWHTRVAKLLNQIFEHQQSDGMRMLRLMSLLPLDNGSWANASLGAVYFALTDGMHIPRRINVQFISRSVTDTHRLALFKHLGVTTASVSLVRKSILETYVEAQKNSAQLVLDLEASKEHLEFLYRTEHLKDEGEPAYSCLALLDDKGTPIIPILVNLHIANNDNYGPNELFRKTNPGPLPGDNAPGYSAVFINKEYFDDTPATPPEQCYTWLEWLTCRLFVLKDILFTDSNIRKYVAQHRPEKYLGILYRHLHFTSRFVDFVSIDELRDTKVLCQGNQMIPLKNTYFATTELKKRVERFIDPGVFFPWLWTDAESTPDVISPEWNNVFKQLGGVGLPSSELDMALDMLKYSVNAFPSAPSSQDIERLFDLYGHILSEYQKSGCREEAKEKIRALFLETKYICIPRSLGQCVWAFPSDCVWKSPQDITVKFALKHLYDQSPVVDILKNDSSLELFFTTVLGITDCTCKTYISELEALKSSNCEDFNTIDGIFRAMNSLLPAIDSETRTYAKQAFENKALICSSAGDGLAWHNVSQCVWSSSAIPEKCWLNEKYDDDLRPFFVDFLRVQQLDIEMAIDQLKNAASQQSVSVEDVKRCIWIVNSLLSGEKSEPPDSQGVLNCCIFPVRFPNATVSCRTLTTDFVIIDRAALGIAFAGKVKSLAFTLEEVVQLSPFLNWTGLSHRYMSRSVLETTHLTTSNITVLLNPDRQIRNRAYALVRLAAHFGSPRAKRGLEALYENLRSNFDIWVTDGLESAFCLYQDGMAQRVASNRATPLVLDFKHGVSIYLPRNKDDQDYAYTKMLALPLFKWIMEDKSQGGHTTVNKEGVSATRDILVAPLAMLGAALDDNGIASINIPNLDEKVAPKGKPSAAPEEAFNAELGRSLKGEGGDADEAILTPPSSIASPSPKADVLTPPNRHSAAPKSPQRSPQKSPSPDSAGPLSLPVRLAPPAKPTTP